MSAFIGFSGPETPKYLLANNFLSEFFRAEKDNSREITGEDFCDKGTLICEEDNDRVRRQLMDSFQTFFRRFSGEDAIASYYSNQHFYFPLTPQMVRCSSSFGLRHFLFNMLSDAETAFTKTQNLLAEYLYGEIIGVNSLITELIGKTSDHSYCRSFKEPGRKWVYKENISCTRLGKQFQTDLECLLTHRHFRTLDFYKKYDYLATLLNFYVILFIVQKCKKSKGDYILCQGAVAGSNLSRGEYHRACVQNYANIRSVFAKEMREYYLQCLDKTGGSEGIIGLTMMSGEIFVNDGEITLTDFIKQVFNSQYIRKENLYQSIQNVFGLEEGILKSFSREEFAAYYIDATKGRRGSTLTKISSVLPTCGKDMGFVFPPNRTKHKYFALSPSLLEFFVRFYLATFNRDYAYLDHFTDYLENTYHIYLLNSEGMDRILGQLHTKVPIQQFRQNEEDLLENLKGINCLIRLSDSGYVVTLPERKGEFRLL